MAAKKRVRGANWSDGEMKTLIDYVAEHYNILFDKLNVKVTRKKKNLMWQEATEIVNGTWGMNRPVRKIKRKWFELKACAVAFQSSRKNVPTGGVLPDEKPWYIDTIIDIIGEDNEIVNESDDGEESTDAYDPSIQNKDIKQEHWHDECSNGLEAVQDVIPKTEETIQAPPWKRLLKTRPIQAAPKSICHQEGSTVSDLGPSQFPTSHFHTQDRLAGFTEKRRNPFDDREAARAAKVRRPELMSDLGSRIMHEHRKFNMEMELMEVKLQAARKQHEMEVELLKIKTECSKLKHLKLYYEVRKLERELGVPGELGVNTLMTTKMPVQLDS